MSALLAVFRPLVLHDIARHCADHGAFLSAEDIIESPVLEKLRD